ncbi:MAG TPA: ribosome biogenesis GTPase Der [bacterium]
MPAIAIVGRKNVGKSTIFNRLMGMRLSIVYKEPGVTRDRLYGEMIWCGRNLDIIDTGGFFPDEELPLARKISRQIELALREADLIYFVVDAKSGLTPSDEDISKELRRTGKPVFLLINKIDNRKDDSKAFEFGKLGYRDIFPVSGEGGFGFGEVLDATLKILKVKLAPAGSAEQVIKLLIVGRPNAGKSTLFNAILREERAIVDEKPGTTRDLINARFKHSDRVFEIIDTAGIRRRSRVKESIEFYSMMRVFHYIEQVDIVILIFDISQGVVKEDCRIVNLALSKAKGVVIVPNKIDLVPSKDRRKILPSVQKSLDFIDFAPVIPMSAKDGKDVDTLLNHIMHVYAELNKTADRQVLESIVPQIKPPPGGAINSIVQVGKKPPVFNVSTTVPVRESYLEYLRNFIRKYFGFTGVPILMRTKIRRGSAE